jgi:Ca2+-binding RTX toxin-like protein
MINGIKNNIINGSQWNDSLIGTWNPEIIKGQSGNDIIFGLGSYDEIYGDDGDDTLVSGHGNNSLFGGEGKDKIYISKNLDKADGGAGDDMIYYQDEKNPKNPNKTLIIKGGEAEDTAFLEGTENDYTTKTFLQELLEGNYNTKFYTGKKYTSKNSGNNIYVDQDVENVKFAPKVDVTAPEPEIDLNSGPTAPDGNTQPNKQNFQKPNQSYIFMKFLLMMLMSQYNNTFMDNNQNMYNNYYAQGLF